MSLAAVAGLGLMAGACAGSSAPQLGAAQPTNPLSTASTTTSTTPATDSRSELQKATEYWGNAYSKDPRDAQAGLNYARNLKAMGEKRQALAVLQQVSVFNGQHRGINAEYGKLAVEFDQVSLAEKLLAQADDPTNPDWTVISARGTVLAKQGRYREAVPFFERALALQPEKPSLLNNLALAHAMEGHPEKAEPLLKRAAAAGGPEAARVSQNLALVLGLQGKYDEAKIAAAKDLPPDRAAANVEYVRQLVNVEPKPLTTAALDKPKPAELRGSTTADPDAASGWSTQVAVAREKPAR
jgi:Flp pilus assembly protein TadD